MADDLFTVHEVIAYYGGIYDTVVIAIYGIMACVYLFVFRSFVMSTEYSILLLALMFFGVSIFVDMLNPKDSELIFALVGDRYHLVEDGPKLIGIAVWLAYFARVAWTRILLPRKLYSV